MFLFFYVFFVFLFSYFIFFVRNIFFWWSIFLIITLIFLFILKFNSRRIRLLNYFIVQEFCGLIFLIFSYELVQFIIVSIKSGVSPFHFWLFFVLSESFGFRFIWFFTFQKIPYIISLFYYLYDIFLFILFLGLIFCFFQVLFIKNLKFLIAINSTESFNWIILRLFLSFLDYFFLFFFYVMFILFMIPVLYFFNLSNLEWELILFFLNIPFSVNFFVKIFSFSLIRKISLYFCFLMFIIFLSVLGFRIILIKLRTSFNFYKIRNLSYFSFIFSLIIFFL